MLWFTSDLHLGHANVLKFANRPWDDVDAMASALIRAINDRVSTVDELYILGDYSYKISWQQAAALRKRINCQRVHLVPGNHDVDWSLPDCSDTFILEQPICRVKDVDGRQVVLSHYPLMDWQGMSHGSWHLHGHIHSPRSSAVATYNELNLLQGLRRYDVGTDANGYAPVSLDEVREWFQDVGKPDRARWWNWVNGTANPDVEAACEQIRALLKED